MQTVRESRAKFGTDAERYCSSLFHMNVHHNKQRRPDLITRNNLYSPHFTLEVKSAKKGKGILVLDQLAYGIRRDIDYTDLVRKFSPSYSSFKDFTEKALNENESDVAMYYNTVSREDVLTTKDLLKPYSAIQLTWGDQHIIPHEIAFNIFAISYARKNKNKNIMVKATKRKLMENLAKYDGAQLALWNIREELKSASWQNLEGRMIKALVTEDLKSASQIDKLTIKLLKKNFPEFQDLKKIILEGPNSTKIYSLIYPQHENLFREQIAHTIKQQTNDVENLIIERNKMKIHLDKFDEILGPKRKGFPQSFANGNIPEKIIKELGIDTNLAIDLDYLCRWGI